LGTEWSLPWLGLFARGAKLDDSAAHPSPDTLMDAWREVSGVLAGALENASEDLLSQPSTQGPPSADGKVSGVVRFLAYHETYHVGQAAYLRCWLGHKGMMG
jgi:DinB superfamily